MYNFYILKRLIEGACLFPFILAGRMIAEFYPLKKQYRIFFFFPFCHTGGAEKVHAQISQAAGGDNCIIFFTKKSVNQSFLSEFQQSGCDIKDISSYTDNKWIYFLNFIYRGIVAGYINSQQKAPIVFNGQCNFGYKISPWINRKATQIELIHSFNSFSYIRIPFLPFIDKTIMISKKRIAQHLLFYKEKKIPEEYGKRINYIPNAIQLPAVTSAKETTEFIVLYVGRGGKEKRVHLIAEMARRLHTTENSIQFHFLGDVSNVLHQTDYPYIHFYGNQDSKNMIHSTYSKAHVLILTSVTEGFPMVVIEGMANGCAIVATPVGDIPYHIKNGQNGFLFSTSEDETTIVNEGIEIIKSLQQTPDQLANISKTNIQYAIDNFGIDKFNTAYRELIKDKEIETS
jgi:L-malate glycosyltransferase